MIKNKVSSDNVTATQSRRSFETKSILICSPDSGQIASETQFFAPPLGVMRLVGYLNTKGHEAEYYDPNLYACNKKGPSLSEKIAAKAWDIIGFSVLDEALTQLIRNIYGIETEVPALTGPG